MLCLVALVFRPERLADLVDRLPFEVPEHERRAFHPRSATTSRRVTRSCTSVLSIRRSGERLCRPGRARRRRIDRGRPRRGPLRGAAAIESDRSSSSPRCDAATCRNSPATRNGSAACMPSRKSPGRRLPRPAGAGHPVREPVDSAAVALDERAKSFAISVAGQRDGGGVRLRHPVA